MRTSRTDHRSPEFPECLCSMTDYKLEEVVNKMIKFHRAETWKNKT